jgi:hypothetical protein
MIANVASVACLLFNILPTLDSEEPLCFDVRPSHPAFIASLTNRNSSRQPRA